MKKLILLLTLYTSIANSQDLITFSAEYGTEKSIGFELRKEYEQFYVGLYAENLNQNELLFNWGFNGGLKHELDSFTLFYGINAGLIKKTAFNANKEQKLLLGIHTELDYNINECFFIGVKLKADTFNNQILTRPIFKIGYKF